jgi:phosphoglycolate phosphatase
MHTRPPRTLLLWDIDGTILRTGGAGMRAMAKVAATMFGQHCVWEGIEAAGSLDPVIFAQFAALNRLDDPHAHHERFRDRYLDQLSAELDTEAGRAVAMPGVHDVLALLRERSVRDGDVVLGLLTGNYTGAVPIKLRAVGVEPEWFSITAFGDEGASRPDLVELALKRYQSRYGARIDTRRAIVIGDTPRDIHCAKAHGCFSLAVATGGFSVDELLTHGPDIAVSDLSDPQPLLDLLV